MPNESELSDCRRAVRVAEKSKCQCLLFKLLTTFQSLPDWTRKSKRFADGTKEPSPLRSAGSMGWQ